MQCKYRDCHRVLRRQYRAKQAISRVSISKLGPGMESLHQCQHRALRPGSSSSGWPSIVSGMTSGLLSDTKTDARVLLSTVARHLGSEVSLATTC